jgi:hypothetical protein
MLKALLGALSAVNTEATALCDGLTVDQLAWRPRPAKWSIAENLIHLCITTEVFIPAVDHAMVESRRRNLLDAGPFRLGWYGRLAANPATSAKSPPAPNVGIARTSLGELPRVAVDNDAAYGGADGLNLAALRFPSPLASYIRMNLLEFFSVFNGHSRRHLWQAANVRRGMPS